MMVMSGIMRLRQLKKRILREASDTLSRAYIEVVEKRVINRIHDLENQLP